VTELCRRIGAATGRLGNEVEREIKVDELHWWARALRVNLYAPTHSGRGLHRPVDLDALKRGLLARGWIGAQ